MYTSIAHQYRLRTRYLVTASTYVHIHQWDERIVPLDIVVMLPGTGYTKWYRLYSTDRYLARMICLCTGRYCFLTGENHSSTSIESNEVVLTLATAVV